MQTIRYAGEFATNITGERKKTTMFPYGPAQSCVTARVLPLPSATSKHCEALHIY